MAQVKMSTFRNPHEIVAALSHQDPASAGSALSQIRHACTIRPTPKVILEYLRQDPTASAVSGALSIARESNSIHLLSNCLYTLAHLISIPSPDQFGSGQTHDASRIIHDIIRHHSKSLHRCFAPGRTEATLSCLTLLYACVSWNDGASAHVVITDLRWDQKTISRLLDTRQTVAMKGTSNTQSGSKNAASKASKIKGRLHEVDVRTLVLKLIMKILTTSDLRPAVKLEFWKTKGLSAGLFKGLRSDGYRCVSFILSNLWNGVVRKDGWSREKDQIPDSNGTGKSYDSRWDIFDQTAITSLTQLLDHEDYDESNDVSLPNPSVSESTAELAERFLTHLTDYISSFTPSSVFQSHVNSRLPQYRLLLNLIKSLSPTHSTRHQRLTLHILKRSPSLCPTLWRHASPATEPSCTVNWISSIGFASKVASIRVTIPISMKHRAVLATDNKNTLINICSNLLAQCFPTLLGKSWFAKTLQHSNSLIVYCCLTLLVIGMKKAASIISQIRQAIAQYGEKAPSLSVSPESSSSPGPWSSLLMQFNETLQSMIPDLQILIAILQKTSKAMPPLVPNPQLTAPGTEVASGIPDPIEPKTDEFSSDLISHHVLTFLQLCHDLIPDSIYHVRFDYGKLVPVYLKLQSNEPSHSESKPSHVIHDPFIYLCQSRILHLVKYSASINPTIPSSTLLTYLLSLSSTSRNNSSAAHQSDYVPHSVSHAARETLKSTLNIPQLHNVREMHEMQLWIDALTEIRAHEESAPLIAFLDDCYRACLRTPLKFIDSGVESKPSTQPPISILYSALMTKTTTVLKAYPSDASRNGKSELVSQLIKFHNLHLLGSLSSSHESLPAAMVQDTCKKLSQLFSSIQNTEEGDSPTLPVYLGPMIMSILQCPDEIENLGPRLKTHNLDWSSYLTTGVFSRQIVTLNFLHRKFIWPHIQKQDGKRKKGVLMIDFGDELPSKTSPDSTSQSQHKEPNLFFMTRALELLDSSSSPRLLPSDSESHLNYDKLRIVIQLILDYLDDMPALVEMFLNDIDVRRVLERSIKDADISSMFSDVLCHIFPKLDKSHPTHRELAKRFSDLIIKSISSSNLDSDSVALLRSSCSTSCVLLEFLEPLVQIQLLDTILTSSKIKSNKKAKVEDLLAMDRLMEVFIDLMSHYPSNIDLSLPSIKALINLACLEKGETATELLSILINQQSSSVIIKDPSARPAPFFQVCRKFVTKTLIGNPAVVSISIAKLKLLADLSRRDRETYTMCVQWISTTTTERYGSSLEGFYSVLVACMEVYASRRSRRWSPEHDNIFVDSEAISSHLPSIVSVLFDEKVILDSSELTEHRSQRSLGSRVIRLAHSSGLNINFDDSFINLTSATELLPAYAETLDALRICDSIHVEGYIFRCLRWLVRRFAEDDELSIETRELTESLDRYLGSSSSTLPPHFVNPVISAAIDRWLLSDFVMRLADRLLRHTTLTDTDTLKHSRTMVEHRQFKALMGCSEPTNDEREQASLVISLLITLITAFPTVSFKIELSGTLIGYYGGTMSTKDRSILQLLRIEDLCTQDSRFDQLLLSWKLQGRMTNSGLTFTELMSLLDPQKMYTTCVQSLNPDGINVRDESCYDPDFMLVYLFKVLDQGTISMASWMLIARTNLLGLAMCALSSSSQTWRMLGDRCLTRAYKLLKDITHTEAAELLLPIEHFRSLHAIDPSKDQKVHSIPSLITLFLVQCLYVFSASPESTLYPRLSRFLMQRAMLDVMDVPMLYSMLYSEADRPVEDQRWLLEFLRDGLQTTRDWKIMDRRQTFEILISMVPLMGSTSSDPRSRVLLLELLERATSHNQPCTKLITQSSLLTVLKRVRYPTITELGTLVKILWNVTSRIGILHENVAMRCVDGIIEIIIEICQSSSLKDHIRNRVMMIVRGVLMNSTIWLRLWNRYQLVRLDELVRLLISKDSRISVSECVREVRARLLYLEYRDTICL